MSEDQSTSLAKKASLMKPEELNNIKKNIIKALRYADHDPDSLFLKIHEIIKKGDNTKDKKQEDKSANELGGEINALSLVLSLDTKHHLMLSVNESDRTFAIEMARSLEAEYNVQTPSEKALVQIATAAYCQMHQCIRVFNDRLCPEWFSHEKAHFLSIYSKEADKANRRFISAIQTLKQIKQQPIKVNVKANNAFMAQNQQINSPANNENNKKQ